MTDTPLLLVGLGNPGAEYARHRHNLGFMALDTIHASYPFAPWRARFHGAVSDGTLGGRKTYLLKPGTYMNESGRAVGEAMRFFKLPLNAVVVIHDEIDLAAAKLRVKTGGGDAGNNGARSITAAIGSDYRRVRIGVGHPGDKRRVHGHVLGNFSRAEEDEWVVPMLSAIAEAAPLLANDDDAGFMNRVHLVLHPPAPKKPKPEMPKPEKKEEQA